MAGAYSFKLLIPNEIMFIIENDACMIDILYSYYRSLRLLQEVISLLPIGIQSDFTLSDLEVNTKVTHISNRYCITLKDCMTGISLLQITHSNSYQSFSVATSDAGLC